MALDLGSAPDRGLISCERLGGCEKDCITDQFPVGQVTVVPPMDIALSEKTAELAGNFFGG